MIKTAVGICREEGLLKLWHGMSAACFRHLIYSGTRIITYKGLKERLVQSQPDQKYFPLYQSALCEYVAQNYSVKF